MRDPVESVMKATRRLLENALEEEPKKLVESILENALLLQSSLQEKETVNALASGDAAATGASQQPTGASSASGDSVLAAA